MYLNIKKKIMKNFVNFPKLLDSAEMVKIDTYYLHGNKEPYKLKFCPDFTNHNGGCAG